MIQTAGIAFGFCAVFETPAYRSLLDRGIYTSLWLNLEKERKYKPPDLFLSNTIAVCCLYSPSAVTILL
jgi:hypothetical protein